MEIALIDSFTNQEKFVNQYKNYSLIIAFDYESHIFLSTNNIEHKNSDDFTTDSELEKLQKQSYHYSKWFKINELEKFIIFNDINLGELFYTEFHYYLVPILKKFYEVTKIFKKFSSAKFTSNGNLFKIISEFSNNVSLLHDEPNSNEGFLNDSIKKTFKLGKKEISLNLSRTRFKKIKSNSELLVDKFFHPKKNHSYDTLLIEFDPIKYEKLLTSMPKSGINGLFLGLRRPAIWNKKSLSIFKKSKSHIATSKILLNEHKKIIQEGQFFVNNSLDKFNDFNKKFIDYFSFEEISFWNIIKSDFLNLCQKRMNEFISDIITIDELLKNYKIKTILLWSEQSSTEIITLKFSKKYNIPTYLLQHGYYHDTKESFEYLDFMGNIPRNSSNIIVWGDIFQNYLKTSDINEQKIIQLGNPFYDGISSRKAKNLKNDYVLLATSGPVDNIINDLKIDTRTNYIKTIKEICSVVIKNNKKLIIKLHPWQEEFFPSEIIEAIHPDVQIIKEKNILDLIENCSIFITIDTSTTILEAFSLEKPSISVSAKNYGWGIPSIFKNNYCLNIPPSKFSQIFEKIISNKSYRNQLIINGNLFLNNYLTNFGKSSINTLEYLKNYPNS